MSIDTVSTFLALLSLIALAIAILAAVALTGRAPAITAIFEEAGLTLATAIAATATAGSLYYSQSAGFVPCELCWYQRIAMYPLVVILGVAALRRSTDVAYTAVPLAAIGAAISAYHYQLQLFPDQGSSCALDTPCTARWVDQFGFISIPLMAFFGFVAIMFVTLASQQDPQSS